jgi:hypothetical protein
MSLVLIPLFCKRFKSSSEMGHIVANNGLQWGYRASVFINKLEFGSCEKVRKGVNEHGYESC